MRSPDINIACVANIFSRMMHFKRAGDIEVEHAHQFDHLTLLAKGKLKVTVNGVISEFTAPHMIYIEKAKVHALEALIDGTVAYCIHALRNKDNDEIIDPAMIPSGLSALAIAGALVDVENSVCARRDGSHAGVSPLSMAASVCK
jgi:hypothetical protein